MFAEFVPALFAVCKLLGLHYNSNCSGCGAAWLARTVWVGEVVNPHNLI